MSSPRPPFFSVVLPTFNRVAVLPRAIESVLAQELEDFELLVADDGSTDGTTELVRSIPDARLRYLRQENRGVSAARNLGLGAARGLAVTFLDSDDEAEPHWLAVFAERLEDPGVGVVTAGATIVGRDQAGERVVEEVKLPRPSGALYCRQTLLYAPPGTLAARRELLVEVGGFTPEVRFAENAELAMRLIPACVARGLRVEAVDRTVVIYHRSPQPWREDARRFQLVRESAEYILERHGARMREVYPEGYANYRGVAAINAARLGELGAARKHLLSALRVTPSRFTNYLRLALTLAPPLATRFWTRHGR